MTEQRDRHELKADAGFTLVELMVTLVVIAIGVLALAGVQTRSSSSVYSTGRQVRAIALGQERMEIARSSGFTGVAGGTGQAGVFAWATRVDSLAPDLKQVLVTVSWPESRNTRSVQLGTLMSAR